MDSYKRPKMTKAKVKKGAIGLCFALCIGLCGLTSAKIVERENGYRSVAKSFIEQTYEVEDNSLYLGEYNDACVMQEYKPEAMISRGKYIRQEIENRGILYCEFLDEYYTQNGMPIAIIDTYLSEEGKACYRRIEVLDNLEEPFTIADNEDIRIISTKPYSDLEDMSLVVEMSHESMVKSGNKELYKGSLRLKK